jgi:hypothetical protein
MCLPRVHIKDINGWMNNDNLRSHSTQARHRMIPLLRRYITLDYLHLHKLGLQKVAYIDRGKVKEGKFKRRHCRNRDADVLETNCQDSHICYVCRPVNCSNSIHDYGHSQRDASRAAERTSAPLVHVGLRVASQNADLQ